MINMDRASVERHQGGVRISDADTGWTVHVTIAASPLRVTGLTVDTKRGAPGVTAARLAKLPMGQIAQVAGTELLGGEHEGEAWYRMLAKPKPRGLRDWPDEHWGRVAAVAEWARDTGRPGGAGRAVRDLWGVSQRTAMRWLSQSR